MTPLPEPFASARRVLLLHAHPDDESLSTGGIIALLRANGADVTVVTGTRGERGEVVDGPQKHLEGTEQLAAVREAELAGAMAALGVDDQRFLGSPTARAAGRPPRRYVDSGMRWVTPSVAAAAADASPASLSLAPLSEVVADIENVIGDTRPDLIVTYNAHGGYGHPDHVRMHDAGVLAASNTRRRVLFIEPHADAPTTPDSGPQVLTFDIATVLDAKRAALAAHRTQLTLEAGGTAYRLSGGQLHALHSTESLRLPPLRTPSRQAPARRA